MGKINTKTKKWEVPKYSKIEFFKKKNKYALVTPVINEGDRIKNQIQKLKKYSKIIDIIIADGGSTDGSTKSTFLKKNGVRAILICPSGQSRQLRVGLSWALNEGYDGVITVDGNGKDDISAIPKFIKALEQGFDYVQGSRFIKGGHHANTPIFREIIARFIISPTLSIGARHWYTDTPNNFRAYSKKYLVHPEVQPFRDIFVRYETLFYLVVRANRLGLKTKEVPVTRKYPKGQIPTKIVGWKKVVDMVNIFKIALGYYNP